MPRPERLRLGDLLIRSALISPQQLEQALAAQRQSGRRLGRVLADSGWVSDTQIARAVAQQTGLPFVDLASRSVAPAVAALLPETKARRLRALPLEELHGAVRVAMADPSDLQAYDELSRLLGRDVELAVVTEADLMAAIDRAYRGSEAIAGLARELTSELAIVDSELGEQLGLHQVAPEDAPVVRLLASVFEAALKARASDNHIEPQERLLRIRFRVDGMLQLQTETELKIAAALALRLKLMASLDIAEKRLPQDGRFNVRLGGGNVDVRISTMPTQHGESVVLRLLDQASGLLALASLQMPAAVDAALRRAIARPSGMVLVTGPTGSGKTTTLYAALAALNDGGRKIITVEDPVEYRLPGLNQVQVMEKIDLGFDRVLRAALRQDPDVILIGEMRDHKTAETGMRAAMTGHLVLSTLHTNDAQSTPVRLLDMGVPRYMVAMSLQLVIAQRLLRLLCLQCAESHVPDAREAGWLRRTLGDETGAPAVRRPRGCPACQHSGYRGRTAVYEQLEMDGALVDALAVADPAVFARAARSRMAGATLHQHALQLAAAGRTSIDEAMRVGAAADP